MQAMKALLIMLEPSLLRCSQPLQSHVLAKTATSTLLVLTSVLCCFSSVGACPRALHICSNANHTYIQKITAIGFLSNTCPDSLENHKATKPLFNVGPSLAHQRKMAVRWCVNGDLLIAL